MWILNSNLVDFGWYIFIKFKKIFLQITDDHCAEFIYEFTKQVVKHFQS